MNQRNSGFSLVEIAVVLVIIGLLLGGILKGQEMINSAKVRNLADMSAGISAAYFGFLDRYRRVPGDWNAAEASDALGVVVNGGGDDNGRLDSPAGAAAFQEPNALWEQLAAAGFLEGAYTGVADPPTIDSKQTPLNSFNQNVLLGNTPDYVDAQNPSPPSRLNLMMGGSVPVDIARELDVKMDDGVANTGVLRLATDDPGTAVFGELGVSAPACQDAGVYNVASDEQDCTPVFLY